MRVWRSRSRRAPSRCSHSGYADDEILAEARDLGADLLVLGTPARGWGAAAVDELEPAAETAGAG